MWGVESLSFDINCMTGLLVARWPKKVLCLGSIFPRKKCLLPLGAGNPDMMLTQLKTLNKSKRGFTAKVTNIHTHPQHCFQQTFNRFLMCEIPCKHFQPGEGTGRCCLQILYRCQNWGSQVRLQAECCDRPRQHWHCDQTIMDCHWEMEMVRPSSWQPTLAQHFTQHTAQTRTFFKL